MAIPTRHPDDDTRYAIVDATDTITVGVASRTVSSRTSLDGSKVIVEWIVGDTEAENEYASYTALTREQARSTVSGPEWEADVG